MKLMITFLLLIAVSACSPREDEGDDVGGSPATAPPVETPSGTFIVNPNGDKLLQFLVGSIWILGDGSYISMTISGDNFVPGIYPVGLSSIGPTTGTCRYESLNCAGPCHVVGSDSGVTSMVKGSYFAEYKNDANGRGQRTQVNRITQAEPVVTNKTFRSFVYTFINGNEIDATCYESEISPPTEYLYEKVSSSFSLPNLSNASFLFL